MAKKDEFQSEPVTEPVQGEDLAAVSEPTRYAQADAERPTPDYVVATEDLFVGAVRAHSAGETVPVANVEKHGWQDQTRPL
jgi:hypothetical protein